MRSVRGALRCPECGGYLTRAHTLVGAPGECLRVRECARCRTRYETREAVTKKILPPG